MKSHIISRELGWSQCMIRKANGHSCLMILWHDVKCKFHVQCSIFVWRVFWKPVSVKAASVTLDTEKLGNTSMLLLQTRGSAHAERPCDALCLSVDSFVEFYLYPTVSTALVHSVKPKLTE